MESGRTSGFTPGVSRRMDLIYSLSDTPNREMLFSILSYVVAELVPSESHADVASSASK
jgi:hypothetical protein